VKIDLGCTEPVVPRTPVGAIASKSSSSMATAGSEHICMTAALREPPDWRLMRWGRIREPAEGPSVQEISVGNGKGRTIGCWQ